MTGKERRDLKRTPDIREDGGIREHQRHVEAIRRQS